MEYFEKMHGNPLKYFLAAPQVEKRADTFSIFPQLSLVIPSWGTQKGNQPAITVFQDGISGPPRCDWSALGINRTSTQFPTDEGSEVAPLFSRECLKAPSVKFWAKAQTNGCSQYYNGEIVLDRWKISAIDANIMFN